MKCVYIFSRFKKNSTKPFQQTHPRLEFYMSEFFYEKKKKKIPKELYVYVNKK